MKNLVIPIVFMLATASIHGQSTPEAIIAQCPALPSPHDLATGNTEVFKAEIARLKECGERLIEKKDVNVSQADVAKVESEAEARAKQMTGYSVAQLQNMSDAERQALANKLVSQQMAVAQQQQAAMQQLPAQNKNDAEKMKKYQAAHEAQTKLQQRLMDITLMQGKEHTALAVKIAEINRRYEPSIKQAFEQEKFDLEREIRITRDTEAFTLWRAQIGKEQDLFKTLLPEAQRVDEMMEASNAAQPEVLASARGKTADKIAKKATVNGVMSATIVGRYLTTSESVLKF